MKLWNFSGNFGEFRGFIVSMVMGFAYVNSVVQYIAASINNSCVLGVVIPLNSCLLFAIISFQILFLREKRLPISTLNVTLLTLSGCLK